MKVLIDNGITSDEMAGVDSLENGVGANNDHLIVAMGNQEAVVTK